MVDERRRARSAREALRASASAASFTERASLALWDSVTVFFACERAERAMSATLRLLCGEDDPPRDPLLLNTSCILRLAPATSEVAVDLALGWSLDLGPKTPRHEAVPHRHSWTFLAEKGSKL